MKGAIHKKVKRFNIEIPGIICGGLCYTLLIEVPDLPIDHNRTNLFICSQLIYESDKQLQKNYDKLSLKTLYEIQQQHISLMNTLDRIPPKFHWLPFNLWNTSPHLISTPKTIYFYCLGKTMGCVIFVFHIIYLV